MQASSSVMALRLKSKALTCPMGYQLQSGADQDLQYGCHTTVVSENHWPKLIIRLIISINLLVSSPAPWEQTLPAPV